jgi:hypothetical protein
LIAAAEQITSPDPNKPRQFHFKTLSFTTKLPKPNDVQKSKKGADVSIASIDVCGAGGLR